MDDGFKLQLRDQASMSGGNNSGKELNRAWHLGTKLITVKGHCYSLKEVLNSEMYLR